jgi:cytochrome oxidase Cu insertion factor (SCO1/SenC/PrrC family)
VGFRGKWVLLYFGYAHCPDACPTAVNTIAEALDQLGAAREKIHPIFIALDPERDTYRAKGLHERISGRHCRHDWIAGANPRCRQSVAYRL